MFLNHYTILSWGSLFLSLRHFRLRLCWIRLSNKTTIISLLSNYWLKSFYSLFNRWDLSHPIPRFHSKITLPCFLLIFIILITLTIFIWFTLRIHLFCLIDNHKVSFWLWKILKELFHVLNTNFERNISLLTKHKLIVKHRFIFDLCKIFFLVMIDWVP